MGSIEGSCIQNQGVEVGVVPLTIMPSDVLLDPIIPVSVDLKILVPRVETLAPRGEARVSFNFKLHPVTSVFSC